MSVFKLQPVYRQQGWGGQRLVRQYGKAPGWQTLAESLELSCDEGAQSAIADPRYSGQTLRAFLDREGWHLLGGNCQRFPGFPLRLKLLDTARTLPVHIHPDAFEYVYVMDCAADACVYVGVKTGHSSWGAVTAGGDVQPGQWMHCRWVQPGDSFIVPPGVAHALGQGITAAQVHSMPETTCSVSGMYLDDNRTPAVRRQAAQAQTLKAIWGGPEPPQTADAGNMPACELFSTRLEESRAWYTTMVTPDSFEALLVVQGDGVLCARNAYIPFRSGDVVFLSAGSGPYVIEGRCRFLRVWVPAEQPRYRMPPSAGAGVRREEPRPRWH